MRTRKVGNPENWIKVPRSVIQGHQQPSIKTNWIDIHQKRLMERLGIPKDQDEGWLFPNPHTGKRFGSSVNLYNFLCRCVKPVLLSLYPDSHYDFYPKIMRTWAGVAKLIETKISSKNWDIREVKYLLGHEDESDVTEAYVKLAKQMFEDHPYNWFRYVLKFHHGSMRMQNLMKGHNGTKSKKAGKEVLEYDNDKWQNDPCIVWNNRRAGECSRR